MSGRKSLSAGVPAFAVLVGCAGRRERITYGDFAERLGLGSPRALGWLLTPLLDWCRARDLPWLPILVVRRSDGLPSGGYREDEIEPETRCVFDFDWARVAPPDAEALARFAPVPKLPAALA